MAVLNFDVVIFKLKNVCTAPWAFDIFKCCGSGSGIRYFPPGSGSAMIFFQISDPGSGTLFYAIILHNLTIISTETFFNWFCFTKFQIKNRTVFLFYKKNVSLVMHPSCYEGSMIRILDKTSHCNTDIS
jgi:hypothetical protein